jgi:drug/metabolite transporter (DMT)-like permease
LASPNVNQLFGALVVSAAALAVAALLLVFQLGKIRLFTNPTGLWFLLGAGAAAFSVDYFTLQAYSQGLPISVGAPTGIAGGVATAVMIGLLVGEQLSFAKLAGIVLVIVGGIVLVAYK